MFVKHQLTAPRPDRMMAFAFLGSSSPSSGDLQGRCGCDSGVSSTLERIRCRDSVRVSRRRPRRHHIRTVIPHPATCTCVCKHERARACVTWFTGVGTAGDKCQAGITVIVGQNASSSPPPGVKACRLIFYVWAASWAFVGAVAMVELYLVRIAGDGPYRRRVW